MPFKLLTDGRLLASIRLVQKTPTLANTLAYCVAKVITAVKSFMAQASVATYVRTKENESEIFLHGRLFLIHWLPLL